MTPKTIKTLGWKGAKQIEKLIERDANELAHRFDEQAAASEDGEITFSVTCTIKMRNEGGLPEVSAGIRAGKPFSDSMDFTAVNENQPELLPEDDDDDENDNRLPPPMEEGEGTDDEDDE